MKRKIFLLLILCVPLSVVAESVLPSWADGATRDSIVAFVESVTNNNGPDFVAEPERIAVFDNDGNLWAEQPAYFQLLFAIDRVKAMAPDHPEWQQQQPFKGIIENDLKAALADGEKALLEIVMATHGGMTTDEFAASVTQWIDTARHPTTGRPFTSMVYQPMLELLDYLRANGFKTYIVSGGGVELMRVFSETVYGIPPEQVVGSTIKTEFKIVDDKPVLVRLPEIDFIDDKAGKPVAINKFIGRRPIAAFGNSDGDYEMLRWVTSGDGARFGLIVHHTDAEREWAYDRESHIGKLDKALTEANERGWTVVDMKNDWLRIFP
ncbi:MAG: haloacid dehalogenase [marine bacterium B5-7]|nr:MAG: haloacid dehalogenase [marine bacterium B5-7]